MDEQLLTGRFSVELRPTTRGQSAPCSRNTAKATPVQEPDSEGETSPRPRSVSRTSSRADKCLRRTKSSFDVELFRSRLRLHKTLSRSKFQVKLFDFGTTPIRLPSFPPDVAREDDSFNTKVAMKKPTIQTPTSLSDEPDELGGRGSIAPEERDITASVKSNVASKKVAAGKYKKAKEKRGLKDTISRKHDKDFTEDFQGDLDILYEPIFLSTYVNLNLPTSAVTRQIKKINLGKDRQDSAIVRYPPRTTQASYRSQSMKKKSARCWTTMHSVKRSPTPESSSSSEGVEEYMCYASENRARSTPCYEETCSSSGDLTRQPRRHREKKICFVDDNQYDSDFEPEVEERADLILKERAESMTQQNTDFGHVTYEQTCMKLGIPPRLKIIHQLCNIVDEKGARSLGDLLSANNWLSHINLSDCSIGDFEIGFILNGLQVNTSVICMNLSKNKIDIRGGRQLGTAIGINNTVMCLNLSWNMIRGGGGVALCNSLSRNSSIAELNLAWNGLAWEGSLSLSEALRSNRTLKKLDISNNRVNWDCIPYLARALSVNRTLEVLEIGHNPVSMDGCMKLLEALDRPSSRITFLSLAEIPIDAKTAFKAAEIAKRRKFTMEHGGVITTRDIFGVQRTKREDPVSLLIRYLSTMGIRVVDLFRVFDTDSRLCVSEANFIRGLKRVRVPLDSDDMMRVARRMQSNKNGEISYQELAASVRSHIREERREDLRQQRLENKKREKRRRILQSDLPLYAPSSLTYFPALYNMYSTSKITSSRAGASSLSPSLSRLSTRDSSRNLPKSPSHRFLPHISSPAVKLTTPDNSAGEEVGDRKTLASGLRSSGVGEPGSTYLQVVRESSARGLTRNVSRGSLQEGTRYTEPRRM
ncbi:hypothetical protein C0Q70_13420 [Pomacea canaliculata]|uniref:EF-hand domain-containing protein n=1 Tax=Pomacea canaliculata TaxID=400727 RepID=A0A2T7NX65_POMCA|nr:hypothetical protein C0Q70_13420 [Pomacea canaliculata]